MNYGARRLRLLRHLARWLFILTVSIASEAQTTRRVPAAEQENGDFGSKFFEDLGALFGRLQKSELQRAFQRAKPIECSDLVGQAGEWKEVAFLNDDRRLGDWHFDSIEEVKRNLVTFAFTGTCSTDQAPVKVTTSYPVGESVKRFEDGKIPLSKVVINENNPVSVVFDRSTDAYTFLLPYLYLERTNSTEPLYTLIPPLLTSKPDPSVALEFRCKAISDAELTYRFLLCRTRVAQRDTRAEKQDVRQPLGNAAYYILSDGKEATSSVKLSFGGDADSKSEPNAPQPEQPPAPSVQPDIATTKTTWAPAASQARLVDIGQDEFRLHFNSEAWNGRVERPQLLTDGMLLDFVATSKPPAGKPYCVWRPESTALVKQFIEKAGDGEIYSLGFKKETQSVITATFEIQSENGRTLGALQCYFPHSETPADVTVGRWTSAVGKHIGLEVK